MFAPNPTTPPANDPIFRVSAFLIAMLSFLAVATADDVFDSNVFRVLKTKCVRCHGPDQQKPDLRFDELDADSANNTQLRHH